MTKLQKALQQVGAPEHAEVLGVFFAPGRPAGEAAGVIHYSYPDRGTHAHVVGFYEEVKDGWDWSEQSWNEDVAYIKFCACVPSLGG